MKTTMVSRTLRMMPVPAYLGNPAVRLDESLDLPTGIALASLVAGRLPVQGQSPSLGSPATQNAVPDAVARNARRAQQMQGGSAAQQARQANANHRGHMTGR